MHVSKHWFALHDVLSKPLQALWLLRLQLLRSMHSSIFSFNELRDVMIAAKPGEASWNQLREHLLDHQASGVEALEKFVTKTQDLVCETLRVVLSMGLDIVSSSPSRGSGRPTAGSTAGSTARRK